MEWGKSETPVEREVIEKVGKKLGIRFPEDYVRVAKHSHGEPPTPDVIDFADMKEKVVGCLLSFAEDSPINLEWTYQIHKDDLPDRMIPFCKDPFGNLYCFDYRKGEEPTIVYWYHEANRLTKVCDTFTEMESMLYEPEMDPDMARVLKEEGIDF